MRQRGCICRVDTFLPIGIQKGENKKYENEFFDDGNIETNVQSIFKLGMISIPAGDFSFSQWSLKQGSVLKGALLCTARNLAVMPWILPCLCTVKKDKLFSSLQRPGPSPLVLIRPGLQPFC